MTQQEVFSEITSQHKWYIGVYSQSYASQLVARFKAGQLKYSTIYEFFKKFGYTIETKESWVKANGKPSNLKTK